MGPRAGGRERRALSLSPPRSPSRQLTPPAAPRPPPAARRLGLPSRRCQCPRPRRWVSPPRGGQGEGEGGKAEGGSASWADAGPGRGSCSRLRSRGARRRRRLWFPPGLLGSRGSSGADREGGGTEPSSRSPNLSLTPRTASSAWTSSRGVTLPSCPPRLRSLPALLSFLPFCQPWSVTRRPRVIAEAGWKVSTPRS